MIASKQLNLVSCWNHGNIITNEINEHICNLIFSYGKYNFGKTIYDKNDFKIFGVDSLKNGCNGEYLLYL